MDHSRSGRSEKVTGYYALFCDVVDDLLHGRVLYREDHLKLAREAHARADLVLAGALEPANAPPLVFREEKPGAAESFACRDPYVINGFVRKGYVRLWTVAAGGETAGPESAAEFAT
jgi:uncharacterized protein YciI